MLFPFHDNNPTRRWPLVTVGIVVLNVAVFLFTLSMPAEELAEFYAHWGFVPKRVAQFGNPQVAVDVPLQVQAPGGGQQIDKIRIAPDQEQFLASLFTCMFLHGGWLHLIGNMWYLWLFGNNIEDRLGHILFFCFYLVAGLLASACHWAIVAGGAEATLPVIGASGAVAGVLGAYAITFPTARVKCLLFVFFILIVELPAMLVLGFWFLMELLSGVGMLQGWGVGGGVAFWAHVGGFVAGICLMPLMSIGSPTPGHHWEDEVDKRFTIE